MIVGALSVALLVILISIFIGLHPLHWLLSLYAAILLVPWLYWFGQRGVIVWRDSFRFAMGGAGWRSLGWTILAFISLTVLLYSIELWRGKRAYAQLQRQLEAEGGSLELKAVIPPPVPEEENFCATPLLAAIVDYEGTAPPMFSVKVEWRHPEIIERLESLRLPPQEASSPGRRRSERFGTSWLQAEMTELSEWQRTFVAHTNFLPNRPSNSPAEDVLIALSRFEPELAELHAARHRTAARWALHYDEGWFAQLGAGWRTVFLRNIVNVLALRATAELSAERPDAALQDVELSWRLAQSLKDEPMFFSQYFRNRMLLTSLQPIWEGLAMRRWSDAQLLQLQQRLEAYDAQATWRNAVRGETYLWMDLFRQLDTLFSWDTITSHFRELLPDGVIVAYGLMWLFYPDGWEYANQVYVYRLYERQVAAPNGEGEPARTRLNRSAASRKPVTPEMPVDPLLAIFVLPRLKEMAHDRASFEAVGLFLQEARLACALERYRLAHGEFPAALEALTPRFLDKLPSAPGGDGLLLEYRRTADGQFLLYPVGLENVSETWDPKKADRASFRRFGESDGVWRYPAR